MGLIIVTGPPAAGKTTWVLQHARPGDITIDFNRIAQALTIPGSDPHDHPPHLRAITQQARYAAIRKALDHTHDCDVYVIHSLPPADALARYTAHGAQLITIDPGRDVVLQRIAQSRPATMRAVAERWYNSVSYAVQSQTRSSRDW